MSPTPYLRITGCIFGLVSLAHLTRAVMGVSVVAGGWEIPMWLSWLGCPPPSSCLCGLSHWPTGKREIIHTLQTS